MRKMASVVYAGMWLLDEDETVGIAGTSWVPRRAFVRKVGCSVQFTLDSWKQTFDILKPHRNGTILGQHNGQRFDNMDKRQKRLCSTVAVDGFAKKRRNLAVSSWTSGLAFESTLDGASEECSADLQG